MNKLIAFLLPVCVFFGSCANSTEKPANTKASSTAPADASATAAKTTVAAGSTNAAPPATDTGSFSGEVPILCYHQIRDWNPKDSKTARVYIVPVANFRAEMKMLHDNGYHSILPDQLVAYLQQGKPLPSKPVLLTFDDDEEAQYTVALPELEKYGFKATFFVMTVTLNRPHYLSKDQVKELVAKGNLIGCHTWDHHMVTKYTDADWVKQIEKPLAKLEEVVGAPIKYFAYPFGLWNEVAVQHLKKYGFTGAFSLSGKTDHENPMFTLSRQIVAGNWTAERLLKTMTRNSGKAKKRGVQSPL